MKDRLRIQSFQSADRYFVGRETLVQKLEHVGRRRLVAIAVLDDGARFRAYASLGRNLHLASYANDGRKRNTDRTQRRRPLAKSNKGRYVAAQVGKHERC